MAMSSAPRAPCNVVEDALFKNRLAKEEAARKCWNERWGFILSILKLLHEEDKTSAGVSADKKVDQRKIKWYPKTGNQEYGWLGTSDEFRLQVYGPDLKKVRIGDKLIYPW